MPTQLSDWLGVLAALAGGFSALLVTLFTQRAYSRSAQAAADDLRTRLSKQGHQPERIVEIAAVVRDLMDGADTRTAERLAALEGELERLRQAAEKDNRRYLLLQEYAVQGLSQSKISFRVSLAAASLGFVVILVGVGMAATGSSLEVTVVPLVAGAVVEAVAALFFVQDKRAQATMSAFFDKLRDDRRTDDAVDLMREVEDPSLKARLQAMLSLHFAGLPADVSQLDPLPPATSAMNNRQRTTVEPQNSKIGV
ncbi:TRADD-N-associated membrane domain-containing protein [Catellatospora citrea]|uniref:Cyanobacterial TRADD-N associated 2 transmembrane domain-containing protein n=1 Tax=Catellatospora citrea TaxID=53366 RepID=A0A8J3KI99_9ACTN|nr:hypothetical protein [Catellatospora citrea]RKE08863.1 hypothetical protein C8E86_3737 [Catellatospora citrea]GIG01265.1 hypothetical protein Cci01nite_63580 [Catellatospora citrea]